MNHPLQGEGVAFNAHRHRASTRFGNLSNASQPQAVVRGIFFADFGKDTANLHGLRHWVFHPHHEEVRDGAPGYANHRILLAMDPQGLSRVVNGVAKQGADFRLGQEFASTSNCLTSRCKSTFC